MIERIKDQAGITISALSSLFNGTSPFTISTCTFNNESIDQDVTGIKISMTNYPHIHCLIGVKEKTKSIRKSTRLYYVFTPELDFGDSEVGLSEQYHVSTEEMPDSNQAFNLYNDAIYFAIFELLKISTNSDD
jgi:hypothetical protein